MCSSITISSSDALPARSPIPLIAHSTWRQPAPTPANEFATASPRSSWQCTESVDVAQAGHQPVELAPTSPRTRRASCSRRCPGTLIVVAPSSSAIWITSAVNSRSSASRVHRARTRRRRCTARACATAARAWPLTSSRVVWSWCSMWMSLVEMKVWMRGRSESLIAFQAASMSWRPVRASPQMTGPCTSRAIAWTASKSPGEAIGKPASMMSTPRRESWWAISSFSCLFSEMPGDCSPSRSVVSKIRTRSARRLSVMSFPFFVSTCASPVLAATRPPRVIPPEGGEGEVAGRDCGTSSRSRVPQQAKRRAEPR